MRYNSNFARFIITVLAVIATLNPIAWGNGRAKKQSSDPVKLSAMNSEVRAKWQDTDALGAELKQKFSIIILDAPYRAANQAFITSKLMGQKYHWARLTLTERQAAKEKLAHYVAAISRIVEIDAKRRYYVTNWDKVRSRYNGALAFQDSLNRFEEKMGESFEPKNPGQAPAYFPPVDL